MVLYIFIPNKSEDDKNGYNKNNGKIISLSRVITSLNSQDSALSIMIIIITGLPYGNPSRKMGRFSVLFFSVSVKVLPVTPLASGVSLCIEPSARIFLGSRG